MSGGSAYHHIDNSRITHDYLSLDQGSRYVVEYVWIDGTLEATRSKSRVLDHTVKCLEDIPDWNFDGSSTKQAITRDSEVMLKARALFRDPFNPTPQNFIVLCDCYKPDGAPVESNNRAKAMKIFEKTKHLHPWFGIEQEYTLYTMERHPLGWPANGYPGPQGPYYCGNGADKVFGREFILAHLHACLYAGVKIGGINAEVMPGQWEFQVGPCEGVEAGDHLWMARHLLARMGEVYRVVINLDPKPVEGDWNGAGAHCNFSTEEMRSPGGIQAIYRAIEKLKIKHSEHIAVYGAGNDRRLTGHHETSGINEFSYGVASRGASIRIPRGTEQAGCGYLEDRRPASNACPYLVTSKITDTTCL
jgi:glutamine synthetase